MQNISRGSCFQTNYPNSKYFPFSIISGQFENSFLVFICLHFVQYVVELPKLPSVQNCLRSFVFQKEKVLISPFHPENFQKLWAVRSTVPITYFIISALVLAVGRPQMLSFCFSTGPNGRWLWYRYQLICLWDESLTFQQRNIVKAAGFIITYNRQGFKRISHTHKWCSNFTVYKTHPRRLLKKKIATGFHRDSDSTNLGWGTGIFFSRTIWITAIQVVHALFFKELINSIRVDFFSLRITTVILIILSF